MLVGSIATAVLVCGALAQLTVGRVVEWVPPHVIFAIVTGIGFLGNLWAAYASGIALLVALAIAIAAIYGQVTVNDMIMARYTADAWRGRVYAVRYFLLFISAGAAIGMISLLHESGGFALVLGVNAVIALLAVCHDAGSGCDDHQRRRQATRRHSPPNNSEQRRDEVVDLHRHLSFTFATMRLRWQVFGSRQ